MQNRLVVDLSHHNPTPNFAAARAAGRVGVIHKATQGTSFIDSRYAVRKYAALAAGLLWGAYHFGTGSDPVAQVDHFIDTVQPDGNFLVALDFERNGQDPTNSMQLSQAKTFLADFQQKAGLRLTFYSGQYVFDTVGDHPDRDLAKHRIWWARYLAVPNLHPTWSRFYLWQYTDGTHGPLEPKQTPGIGASDCNHFESTANELRASWLDQALVIG
jgi:lysozyme